MKFSKNSIFNQKNYIFSIKCTPSHTPSTEIISKNALNRHESIYFTFVNKRVNNVYNGVNVNNIARIVLVMTLLVFLFFHYMFLLVDQFFP